ncbi:Modulator of FtsH protease HflK [Pelagimonas phthalicica]|uniref:Protein HflK n=1 Tax=Pelagimonas phthalicica TaxID=1037362 RepID=A0A238JAZ9_9RHOB|nr:FtsH protease activity modulator HflK [Pelagimonas phthalicica]TDS93631.1 protease FtsH subunit HflK [Pelagimonas phthalicica]SMX27848.1 Modulator of FtsH protease HflK [Pelagimonas phthalicica]
MAGNSGGPWGGGGNNGNNGSGNNGRGPQGGGGKRPDDGQIPEIDELMKKGQEQLRVLMGGRSDNGGGRRNGGGGSPAGPGFTRGTVALGVFGLIALWLFASFYTVRPEEQSVELFLGEYSSTGNPGLNFAPWPLVTAEVVNVTSERSETIGAGRNGNGLMLTTDANIVDIDFQVVWNITDPAKYLFNIRDPELTVQAVSEAVMREIIAATNLAPILNRDRGVIADTAMANIQTTLDEYESGISIVRVNLAKADPPREVINAFREVQEAEQERDRLERQADAYANKVVAEARGSAAQVLEQAEAYRARVVNEAVGEAARFTSVREEYAKAPDVTRKRLYLETMENVLGGVDKMILDPSLTGEGGVVPYLPLNELTRSSGGKN